MSETLTLLIVGVALAIGVGLLAALAGCDRDKGFYPRMLTIIAACYVLFAALAADSTVIIFEAVGFFLFGALAVIGFRGKLWVVAVGLMGHGLFDGVHHLLFANPGVPVWWADVCIGFDVTMGLWLGWTLFRSSQAGQGAEKVGTGNRA